MDQLQSQFMTVAAMKGNNLNEIIWSILYILVFKQIFEWIPIITQHVNEYISNYIRNKTTYTLSKLTNTQSPISSIIIERNYDHSDEDLTADSIIDFITTKDNIKFLKYIKSFYPNSYEKFDLTDNICVSVKNVNYDIKTNDIKFISLEIFSYTQSLSTVKNLIHEIEENYIISKHNKLGNKLCFFNEIIQPISMDHSGNLSYTTAPKNMKFTMTPFKTTKTLDNIYGKQIDSVKDRLNFFLNNKTWYEEKGIPYTFGLLLHGAPGCGKTSLIKALAKMTNRHIINISLHQFLTRTQLNNLFYSDKIYVDSGVTTCDVFNIPNSKKLYIIEDIDAMSDVSLQRTDKDENRENDIPIDINKLSKSDAEKLKKRQNYDHIRKNLENDQITLSYLLNLLDGVLEVENRIIIMTTNYPEKLDKALIRPGRIDLSIEFKKCDKTIILDMMRNYYDEDIDPQECHTILEDFWTPAEVGQIFLNNFDDWKTSVKILSTRIVDNTDCPDKYTTIDDTNKRDIKSDNTDSINTEPIEYSDEKLKLVNKVRGDTLSRYEKNFLNLIGNISDNDLLDQKLVPLKELMIKFPPNDYNSRFDLDLLYHESEDNYTLRLYLTMLFSYQKELLSNDAEYIHMEENNTQPLDNSDQELKPDTQVDLKKTDVFKTFSDSLEYPDVKLKLINKVRGQELTFGESNFLNLIKHISEQDLLSNKCIQIKELLREFPPNDYNSYYVPTSDSYTLRSYLSCLGASQNGTSNNSVQYNTQVSTDTYPEFSFFKTKSNNGNRYCKLSDL